MENVLKIMLENIFNNKVKTKKLNKATKLKLNIMVLIMLVTVIAIALILIINGNSIDDIFTNIFKILIALLFLVKFLITFKNSVVSLFDFEEEVDNDLSEN